MLESLGTKLRINWFIPVVATLFAFSWMVLRSSNLEQSGGIETAVVFDAVVTIPCLFWLCYRGQMPVKAMAIRVIGLQCFGLLTASWFIPPEQQWLLPNLAPFRWIGMALLAVFEAKLAFFTIGAVFKAGTRPVHLTAQGVPEPIAKILLFEAKFWRWVWSKLRK